MWKIFILDGCPYCNKAKHILHNISNDSDIEVIPVFNKNKDYIKKEHGMDTFPIIYKNNELYGGYTKLFREYVYPW